MNHAKMINRVRAQHELLQHQAEWIQFLEYVAKLKPTTIVEVGVYNGASTLCLSHFTKHIIGIDINQKNRKVIKEKIERNCAYDFIRADSQKSGAKLAYALGGKQIDLLFIDGDHSYEGVKGDFNYFLPFMEPDGVIALHDIVDSAKHRKQKCWVSKFWAEIKTQYKSKEIIANKVWGGIGIIELGAK